ncbi:MAG: class II aldolase/adducin family protein [Candidatus Zixiibacteriota bacterium]
MNKISIKKKIIEYGARLYKSGLIASSDGNISVKIKINEILITASGIAKGFMTEDNIIEINLRGENTSSQKKPSSEYLMHTFIYINRPDIAACVHAHPPFTTALSTVNLVPPVSLLPEAVITIGEIAQIPYAPVGTPAVPRQIEPYISNCNAFILKNHGVLTMGADLDEAFNRMETVEHLAKIFYIARSCGEPDLLEPDEIKRLRNL